MNFTRSLHVIKRWLCNLVGSLLRRYHWPFALAGFSALSMAIVSWTLETSESYWFWHRYYYSIYYYYFPLLILLISHVAFFWNVSYSFWHITIYTSSFCFLCSKANIVDIENQLPANGNYELTHQDSLPRNG
jgi:hypothetical protein